MKMSSPRLIFSFKDGLNLTLNKEKAAQGGVVNLDLDYSQVNVEYEGPLMDIVSRRETEGLPSLLKIGAREDSSPKRQKVERIQYPFEGTSQLQSMITTPTGGLVGAFASRVPDAPLRRTQRRNANRRKHRAFVRLERRRTREAEAALTPIPEERVYDHSPRETPTSPPVAGGEAGLGAESTQSEVPDELCPGCPMCNVEIPRRTSAAGAFTECPECNVLHLERYGTFEEYTAASMILRNVNHPEVEPYIPRFVETPQFWTEEQHRRVPKIPTIELERMSRVRK
ncbi:uncharacterized protein LOC110036660, partial [Phalaenopsis equestris]|uniref:uncharacterized protein LOC110036660 n=1 Tax=Phalaenopsis equestris TaxID=78828 RepID=UPI0009E26CC3